MKRIDITGKKYGKLTVIKLHHIKNKRVCYWVCKCECGNYKIINGNSLKNGSIKACGCLRGKTSKYNIQNNILYKKWSHMISRCNNEKDISYKNYGGRGIKVCEEWFNYNNFAKWSIENNFNEQLEIDRIDLNGNYEPSNCRYVTKKKNIRNRRNTLKYNYNGKILSLGEIAEINNINYKLLWQRINRDNLSLEEAIII